MLMVSKFSQSEIGIWVLLKLLLPLRPRTIIGDNDRISNIFVISGGIVVLLSLCEILGKSKCKCDTKINVKLGIFQNYEWNVDRLSNLPELRLKCRPR